VTSPAGEVLQVPVGPGDASLTVPNYRIGSNTASPVTITPYSRFALPPGLAGTVSGAARTINANGIGAPVAPVLTLASAANGDGTSTVTATAAAGANGDGSALRFGIVPEGSRCVLGDTATASFRVDDGVEYAYRMCAESVVGDTSFGRVETTAAVRAVQSTAAPSGWTFVVDAEPAVSDNTARWSISQQPTSSQTPPRYNAPEFSGWPGSTVFDRDPEIGVRYVHQSWGPTTDYARVTPAPGSAPYQVQAAWSAGQCEGGADLALQSSSTDGLATISFDRDELVYYNAADEPLAHEDSWLVPRGAVRADGIGVTVDWSGQGWGLDGVVTTFSAACTPNELPPPAP
jgi:hypothetical protein